MRALLPIAAVATVALLIAGCGGGDSDTLESLAGTPASIHIVKDVEAMARACKKSTQKAHKAAVAAYTGLAEITAIHPNATFGPEGTDVTMHQLLRRTIEKTGHCFGVSVDSKDQYQYRPLE